MNRELLMGLSATLLVAAAVVLTVLYEYVTYRRKQQQNRDLHERMGLTVKDTSDRNRQ